MLRTSCIRLSCCLLVAILAAGQKKVVRVHDGREITGEVTRTKDGYVIKTLYGDVFVPAEQVVSVKEVVTPEDEYRQRLAKIDKNDPEARYKLAEWAFQKDLLEIARTELQAALKLKPETKYTLLLRQVEEKIARAEPAAPGKKQPDETPGAPKRVGDLRFDWLVGDKDISRIRLEELRAVDGVAIEFRNRVLERFIEMQHGRGEFKERGFEERFYGFPPVRKAMYMIRHIDRDDAAIKDDIAVKTDPRFMVDFRRQIWSLVSQSCGTSQCHGGDKAWGGLKLFSVAGQSQRVDYTNFLILVSFYKLKVGEPARRLIDRDEVERSLFLQFGLPPELAQLKHPKEIRPIFESSKVLTYRNAAKWIEDLTGPPYPDYRLDYRPPFGMSLDLTGRPTFQSEGAPASAPAATSRPAEPKGPSG